MKGFVKFVKRDKKIKKINFTPVKLALKKGDQVIVITGDDKNKTGYIEKIKRIDNKIKVLVTGINIKHHFTKEGIIQKLGYIDISNIKLFHDGKACRVTKKANGARKIAKGSLLLAPEYKPYSGEQNV